MFCQQCGVQNTDDSAFCSKCGASMLGRPDHAHKDIGQDAGMRMLLPVGRSGWAIAAGYMGLLSVLGLFAPFALFFGIMAVRDINKNPEKHGLGRAWFGIVMGGLITLGMAVTLFLKLAFEKKW